MRCPNTALSSEAAGKAELYKKLFVPAAEPYARSIADPSYRDHRNEIIDAGIDQDVGAVQIFEELATFDGETAGKAAREILEARPEEVYAVVREHHGAIEWGEGKEPGLTPDQLTDEGLPVAVVEKMKRITRLGNGRDLLLLFGAASHAIENDSDKAYCKEGRLGGVLVRSSGLVIAPSIQLDRVEGEIFDEITEKSDGAKLVDDANIEPIVGGKLRLKPDALKSLADERHIGREVIRFASLPRIPRREGEVVFGCPLSTEKDVAPLGDDDIIRVIMERHWRIIATDFARVMKQFGSPALKAALGVRPH